MDEKDKEKEKPDLLEFFVNEKPQAILAELEKRGFKKVFVGGGSMINALFFDAGLIDEMWITVEPKIFGTGMRILSDKKRDINLTLKSVKKDNQTVLLKYGVKYGGSN
jgi:riboflavin biosynthesis pyrimidine reductase